MDRKVIAINNICDSQEVKTFTGAGDDEFFAVFGLEPKENESGTISTLRALKKINSSLAVKGLLQGMSGVSDISGSDFESRRAAAEYRTYARLLQQYMEEKRKEGQRNGEPIGMASHRL